MGIFLFTACFLLLNRLNKALIDPEVKFKWKQILSYSSWGSFLAYAACQSIFKGDSEAGVMLVGCILLSGILYYVYKQPDFNQFHFYLYAHLPLVGVGLIAGLVQLISSDFYDKYDTFFDCAIPAAFVWTFARWMTSKKQRDELNMITLRNNQLDNLVAKRTAELTEQKNELENTVKLLKATQAQLVQQEKLASLGELTAGIAHEIQNPLNFVNNFSDVSMELIDEMGEELAKGDTAEAMAIANDIKGNLEKIIHHGKRADAIVKGMLQHSRASTGAKEPTDVNALADEYLRLAYHGLRAKDKSFNAELVTKFDPKLPPVELISQDVGRVLLNLFNNAFYATQQKHKTAGPDYKPTIEVDTILLNKQIQIKVKDNGEGMPEDIKDKIMQPFFTTKPTGEGTGLGLSMSYDIIVKVHGGKIDVDSAEGEFTEFTVTLPI